jgi:hypothetical protein
MVEHIMKKMYPVDAQLDFIDYDASYMFRLRTVNLCMDELYIFHFVVYNLTRVANLKITNASRAFIDQFQNF